MRWFKKECKHDWADAGTTTRDKLVGRIKDVRELSKDAYVVYSKQITVEYKGELLRLDMDDYPFWLSQKVCLKCGKCEDEAERAEMRIRIELEVMYQKIVEDRRRSKLAKQMWKNCN